MKVAFYTLGCKVNQHETGAMQQMFLENGYELSEKNDIADICIVNSCTVTASGDKKSRQWLRKCKRNNPQSITVLTGCMPQAFPDTAEDTFEADIVTGAKNRKNILDDIAMFRATKQRIVDITPHEQNDLFEEMPMQTMQEHTRAFVKIQDGCNRFCAYCIIPYARGRARSRDCENILAEVTALANNGYKEIVLTGINLSCYGDETNTNLAEIVEQVATIPGVERIRLGSLEPDLLPHDVLVRLSNVSALCPHFHLSLQSGSDETLAHMNRKYSTLYYKEKLHEIRALFPKAQFTTDIIVGFPCETDAQFAQSLLFVKKCAFSKVHVFTFSARPGTAAFTFPNQLSNNTKQLRYKQMNEMANAMRTEVIKKELGSEKSVLLEASADKTLFTGYTPEYIPVFVSAEHCNAGDIVKIKLIKWDGNRCEAVLVESS